MRTLITLAVLVVLTVLHYAARLFHLGSFEAPGDEATFVLGFALLTSYIFGRAAHELHLPRITGYLIAGLALGPYVAPALVDAVLRVVVDDTAARATVAARAAVLNVSVTHELHIFESVALGLIAFTAGGELRLERIRERQRTIVWVVALQTVIAFGAVAGLLLLEPQWLPHGVHGNALVLPMALLLGAVAVAKSPATTVAVIAEMRSRGPLTDTALGVTVLKDVVVLILFALILAVVEMLLGNAPSGGHMGRLTRVLWHLLGSLGVGTLLGFGVRLYIEHVRSELPLVVLGIASLAMFVAGGAHLSGLLICMTAGFVVENFSEHGSELVAAAERFSMPVYVLFFTLAGASIDLAALAIAWKLALVLVAVRLLATTLGTVLGHRIADDPPALRRWGWSAYIGQAGVSLGLATLVREAFPSFGAAFFTLVVATVALNQLIGPVLFRIGLVRIGEAHAD